jgi:hypothetical protein
MLERVYREIRDNRSEAIVVDVDYMANFLADRLFRNNPAEIYLTSTVSFSIPDCKQKLQTIFSKHKIKEQDIFIELQKCKLVLTKDKMSLHGSDLRSALMHLVVILNDEEDMVVDGETKLRDVMKAVEGIFSKTVEELLGSFMIRDLKTLDIYCNSFLFKSPSRSIDMDRQGRDTPPKTKEADREFNEAVLIFLKYEHQYHQNSKDDEKLKKAKEESKITDVITFDTTVEPIKEKKVDALLKYKGDDQNLSVSEFQFKDLLRVIKLLEA